MVVTDEHVVRRQLKLKQMSSLPALHWHACTSSVVFDFDIVRFKFASVNSIRHRPTPNVSMN